METTMTMIEDCLLLRDEIACTIEVLSRLPIESFMQCNCTGYRRRGRVRELAMGNFTAAYYCLYCFLTDFHCVQIFDKPMTTTMEEDFPLLLPDEIITEILSALPARSVGQCKCICKTWRALIADPLFIHLHHKKAPIEWVTLCNKKGMGCPIENYQLRYGEYNDNNNDDGENINPFKHNHPVKYRPSTATCHLPRKCNTVCSFNGLIFSMSMFAQNMFVCNPFTREYVNLPVPLSFDNGGFRFDFYRQKISLASGFGYNSYTNEYKIVIIYNDQHYACSSADSAGYVTIYTLGSGRWRDKGEISPKLMNGTNMGVFLNGALHWLTEKKEIVSFDLADELFRIVPSPPSPIAQSDHVPHLGLLRGCLYVTGKRIRSIQDPTAESSTVLDIWVMENELQSTFQKKNELQSWTRKFSISWKLGGNHCADGYRPLTLSKSGKLILFHNSGHKSKPLVSYDPGTETSIVDDSFPKGSDIYMIRYVKSLVSLKALGETNADQIDDEENSMEKKKRNGTHDQMFHVELEKEI